MASFRLAPLPTRAKAGLAVRIWELFLRVRIGLRREPLPALVDRLGRPRRQRPTTYAPARLSNAVDRSLCIAGYRPTCLVNALVLYGLLREQGQAAELVIGLQPSPRGKDAHAWVELDGTDVGPPPGRAGHEELARFGRRPAG